MRVKLCCTMLGERDTIKRIVCNECENDQVMVRVCYELGLQYDWMLDAEGA